MCEIIISNFESTGCDNFQPNIVLMQFYVHSFINL